MAPAAPRECLRFVQLLLSLPDVLLDLPLELLTGIAADGADHLVDLALDLIAEATRTLAVLVVLSAGRHRWAPFVAGGESTPPPLSRSKTRASRGPLGRREQ